MSDMTESEAIVMGELVRGARYGLELVERSGGALSRSSIYVLLGRMEDKGWIEGETQDAPVGASGPPRRVYRPTNLGRAHLSAHAVIAKAQAQNSKRRSGSRANPSRTSRGKHQ